ncbi:hypothetical protein V8G54_016208 [Vigna mungo]|uniref:Uncharacterized protein n=1 Tax=Vigna mungo TaxID=3915 RepID=A0AAQ3NNL0_VIGMU
MAFEVVDLVTRNWWYLPAILSVCLPDSFRGRRPTRGEEPLGSSLALDRDAKPSEEPANKQTNSYLYAHCAPHNHRVLSNSMNRGEERETTAFRALADRCRSLEEKQAKLKEEFDELLQKKLTVRHDNDNNNEVIADSTTLGFLSGYSFSGSPYATLLKCMGHAVHVVRVPSAEIRGIVNRMCEKLVSSLVRHPHDVVYSAILGIE